MNDPRIDRIAIIGLGLIGSSLALALRARNLAGEIVGHARSESTRSIALQRGFCDAVHAGVEETVEGAGLVVLATPVGAFVDLLTRAAPHLAPGAVVTDVAGVKGAVVRDLLPLIPEGRVLVPGHPIAGTEQSGPESGFVELFEDRWCVLTPQADTPKEALALVTSIWEGVGSRVEIMTPEHHDRVLAVTSHLPHAIAYTMVGIADDLASVTQGRWCSIRPAGFVTLRGLPLPIRSCGGIFFLPTAMPCLRGSAGSPRSCWPCSGRFAGGMAMSWSRNCGAVGISVAGLSNPDRMQRGAPCI